MTDYPSDLPCPMISDYKGLVDFGISSVKFNRGNTRRRRMAASRLETYELTFAYTAAQLWEFQTWANQFGYDWHYMPIISHYSGFVNPANVLPTRVRISGDLSITTLNSDTFRIRVPIEVDTSTRPFGITVPSGEWIIAGTSDAPSSPNWIVAGTPPAPSANVITAGTPVLPAA